MKTSLIKDVVGDEYHSLKLVASIYAAIYVVANASVYILSLSFHSNIIEWLYSYACGFNLFGLIFIVAFAVALDIPVESSEVKNKKSLAYKFSTMWMILLLVLGVFANYISYSHYNRYRFECTTFYIEGTSGIYHIDAGCEEIKDEEIYWLYGYELEGEGGTFCEACSEGMKEMEEEAAAERIGR